MNTNKRVKLFRGADPTGLGANQAMELVDSQIPVWMTFNRSVVFTSEGIEVVSDGNVRFEEHFKPVEGDVVETSDDKRYRLEQVNEVYSVTGSIRYYDCSLVRDASYE